jgi:hypothetical protein
MIGTALPASPCWPVLSRIEVCQGVSVTSAVAKERPRGFSLDTYSPTGPNFQILVDAIGKLSFPGLKLA